MVALAATINVQSKRTGLVTKLAKYIAFAYVNFDYSVKFLDTFAQ